MRAGRRLRCIRIAAHAVGLLLAGCLAGQAMAQALPVQQPMGVPRISSRLTAADVGVVINTADPYSVEVGAYYAARRGIAPEHIVRVELPVRNSLSAEEFEALARQVREQMPPEVQALALVWTQPFAVECNSITSAMALGLDSEACRKTCAPTRPSRYFNTRTSKPFTDLGMRPAMLLASRTVASAKALVDRGMASNDQLGKLGAPSAIAVFVATPDAARNVRAAIFPPAGRLGQSGLQVVRRDQADTSPLQRVVLLQTGTTGLPSIDTQQWVPGALADHLTSFGGVLTNTQGQMSALEWLEAGATASYGTVSEPCNHLQKFPHPQVLMLHYLQGATALEAYWKSVAWPAQGVFVGEPLAAPFVLR